MYMGVAQKLEPIMLTALHVHDAVYTVKGVDTHDPRRVAFSSKSLLVPVEHKIS